MRLVDKDFPQAASLPNVVKDVTVRLSADYLIHDLQTGHFVTVLRFISPLMQACNLSEYRFYQLLAQVLGATWRSIQTWQTALPYSIYLNHRLSVWSSTQ